MQTMPSQSQVSLSFIETLLPPCDGSVSLLYTLSLVSTDGAQTGYLAFRCLLVAEKIKSYVDICPIVLFWLSGSFEVLLQF